MSAETDTRQHLRPAEPAEEPTEPADPCRGSALVLADIVDSGSCDYDWDRAPPEPAKALEYSLVSDRFAPGEVALVVRATNVSLEAVQVVLVETFLASHVTDERGRAGGLNQHRPCPPNNDSGLPAGGILISALVTIEAGGYLDIRSTPEVYILEQPPDQCALIPAVLTPGHYRAHVTVPILGGHQTAQADFKVVAAP